MKRYFTSEEIKNIELNILLEFSDFCKKNDLKFYLVGGTLLGAIRHKGFIPWDDDIDVAMPRSDYEKFLHLYKHTGGKYEIRSNYLKNFSAPFSKLVNTDTVVINLLTDSSNDIDSSLWIDIIPIDGLPVELEKVNSIYKKVNFYRNVLFLSLSKLGTGRNCLKKSLKYALKHLAVMYGRKRCTEKIEKIAKEHRYEDCEYVGAVTWGLYGPGERMLKAEFVTEIEVEFEGYKFPAFSCWDSYLKNLYGDYMKLPPVEKRKAHSIVAYSKKED